MTYVIISGKPAGEVNHRAKFWTNSLEKAKECESALDAEVAAGGGDILGQFYNEWLWGPHIHEGTGLIDAETVEWR